MMIVRRPGWVRRFGGSRKALTDARRYDVPVEIALAVHDFALTPRTAADQLRDRSDLESAVMRARASTWQARRAMV